MFKDRLYKFIDLCFETQRNVDYMINFLTSIEEMKHFNDLKKEKNINAIIETCEYVYKYVI